MQWNTACLAGMVVVASAGVSYAQITVTPLGTSAPPSSLAGYTLQAAPVDTRPLFTDVVDVNVGGGRMADFSIPMNHRRIGDGWATWSHGYTGDVYFTNGDAEVSMDFGVGEVGAFVLYVEPNVFDVFDFRVEGVSASGASISVSRSIDGDAGAQGFGVSVPEGGSITRVTVTNTDGSAGGFAIGEFLSAAAVDDACLPWTQFTFLGVGDVVSFPLTVTEGCETFKLTDAFLSGDRFDVRILRGATVVADFPTSAPTTSGDPIDTDFDAAFAGDQWSSGQVALEPGRYTVEVTVTGSPFGSGAGAYRLSAGESRGVLVFTEARDGAQWELDAADEAFGAGGYTLLVGNTAALNDALASGRYRCVVIHQPANSFDAGFEGLIDQAVRDGVEVHFSFWNLDASPALRSTFGVASTADFFAPKPVFDNAGHPSWGTAASPVSVAGDLWNDNGDDLTAAGGATVVSRFSGRTGPGATVVRSGADRRTLLNGFEYESMTAAEVAELLEAQMLWVCNPGCILFESLSAGDPVSTQFDGVRFSVSGGGPASVSTFTSFFGTDSVVNATDGGADRRLTLNLAFDPPIDEIEFDFNSAGTPAAGFEFPIRFFRGGAPVALRSVEENASLWRRDVVFDNLSGVTRMEIDSFDAGWLFSLDNICLTAAATCRADLDGDGELTIFDFLAFQNAFDAGDPIADFDGDGMLTIFDFLAFQNEFDAGCP